MATKKTLSNSSVRRFESIQTLMNHLNSGGKVRVIGPGAGQPIGTELYGLAQGSGYTSYLNGTSVVAYVSLATGGSALCYTWTLNSVCYASPLTKEEIVKNIQELEDSIQEHKSRLAYMEAAGTNEYDENEFKVWNTLQVLKTKKNDFEKAKEIAKLISH